MDSITVMERPKQRVAVVPHQGDYTKIGEAFDQLYQKAGDSSSADWQNGVFGVYYGDPNEVPEKDLRSAAAVALKDGEELGELETRELAGGRYAMMEFKGPYQKLPAAWEQFMQIGFAGHNYEPRLEPSLEIYLNNPNDTAPEDLVTILAVPIY